MNKNTLIFSCKNNIFFQKLHANSERPIKNMKEVRFTNLRIISFPLINLFIKKILNLKSFNFLLLSLVEVNFDSLETPNNQKHNIGNLIFLSLPLFYQQLKRK